MKKIDKANNSNTNIKTIGLNLKQSLKSFSYPFTNLSNRGCVFSSTLANKFDAIQGTRVKATTKLAIKE